MSGDGGERSNRRRQNIPSVSIRVLLGCCQPWRERTSRAGRRADRKTVRQTDGCFFPFFWRNYKGSFFFLFTNEQRVVARTPPRPGGCAYALPDRHPNKTSHKDDVEKTKKKEKKKEKKPCILQQPLCLEPAAAFPSEQAEARLSRRSRGNTLTSSRLLLSALCKKAQRGQLLSASSNSSSS